MKQIATALVQAQRNFAPALKTSTNPHFRSKYADLSACVEAVIDALNASGVFLLQQCYENSTGVTVETTFVHESGEVLNCGKLYVPSNKMDAQGFGSALTYARRYSLMAACGIAPEDDDGNAASKPKNKAEKFVEQVTAKPPASVSKQAFESMPAEEQQFLREEAQKIISAESIHLAYEAYSKAKTGMDADEQTALWGLLDSSLRSAIKKHGQSLEIAAQG